MSTTPDASPLRIAPPDPDKPPLKANVFHDSRAVNTALCPLFPYLGDGDMVPAVTLFYGGPGRDTGIFKHFNTVDEVSIMFGVRGAGLRAGDVFTGSREHIVGRHLDDADDSDGVMIIVVTQRQADPGVPQSESVGYLCEKCQNPLLVHRYPSKEVVPDDARPGYYPGFGTLLEGAVSIEAYNAEDSVRTCSKCNHVNPPFPTEMWGWQSYRDNLAAAERSRDFYFDELAAIEEAR